MNDIVGAICGVFTFTPYLQWRHAHAIHHASSGDLDRRGVGDVLTLTVREYRSLSWWKRLGYRLYRHPVVIFGLGPIWVFLIAHRFVQKESGKREAFHVHWTNLAIVCVALLATVLMGSPTKSASSPPNMRRAERFIHSMPRSDTVTMPTSTELRTIPEGELYSIGDRSFSFITGEYMNLSIRLGYHLSTVEAYAGESINDNYIRFFFKGGGAGRDRRFRRVRLITEILKKMDFNLKVTEDIIDAHMTKYKKSALEKRLEIMGKLTAYTKQLDMVMYNDAITDMYIEDFVKAHIKGKL